MVYTGEEPRATVQLFFPGKFDYNYKNVLVLDALTEIVAIKVVERL